MTLASRIENEAVPAYAPGRCWLAMIVAKAELRQIQRQVFLTLHCLSGWLLARLRSA